LYRLPWVGTCWEQVLQKLVLVLDLLLQQAWRTLVLLELVLVLVLELGLGLGLGRKQNLLLVLVL
jgi:hypothetical protein